MPGKVKVRVLCGRNLPVMDRSSDTSDAFVEIKFGSTVYKTDVYRKSLNPQWNSDWFKFEADDEELQDESIQIRVMDYDTYSANDAIGKVFINLKPLLNRELAMICGWFPIFDTMHGIRGEVQVIVKLDLFSDCNKFRNSSCGMKVFFGCGVPSGYTLQTIQGFVEELSVNDDPEYQWIDKIRTSRASNEARQLLLCKLAGEVQRKIGLKALELGANAVLGYQQNFDLEGESGIVLRCIGTAVTLLRNVRSDAGLTSPLYFKGKDASENSTSAIQSKNPHNFSPAKSVHSTPMHKCEFDFCVAQRTGSHSSSTASSGGMKPIAQYYVFNQEGSEVLEYPFITMRSFPQEFIEHIGGIVSAKSVKLLDIDEPETRDGWWSEIRMEVRSHTKALGCNVVLGYSESVSLCDDICILCAYGTAAIVNSHYMYNSQSVFLQNTMQKDEKLDHDGLLDGANKTKSDVNATTLCKVCHIPYLESSMPFPATITNCLYCHKTKVPDVLFTTIEPLSDCLIIGKSSIIQGRVVRSKRDCKGESCAKEISDCLPFLEYELHKQLIIKLKIRGMNTLFGLKFQVSIGEKFVVAVATGTGVLLGPLPRPVMPKLISAQMTVENELVHIQDKMLNVMKLNRTLYDLEKSSSDASTDIPDNQFELDLVHGNKDAFVLEVDDAEDSEIFPILNEHQCPVGFEMTNTEKIPSVKNLEKSFQIFTRIWRAKLPSQEVSNKMLSVFFEDLIRSLFFKVRNIIPCGILNLQFQVDLPEDDEIQIIINGMLVTLNKSTYETSESDLKTAKKPCNIRSHGGSLYEKPTSIIGIPLCRGKSLIQSSLIWKTVELCSLSYVPNKTITEYLGNLSFCLIRECTDVREYGSLSGFVQNFITEVHAIARAQVSALGGNALLSVKVTESVLQHNLHKNQGQSLLIISGDAVLVD